MVTVLEIVLPVFSLILVGYGFARGGFLDAAGARGLGVFVYYAAIPALLFRGMAGGPLGIGSSLGVLGAYFSATLVVFCVAMILGRAFFGLGLAEQGLMGLSASFANSVQLGIPLVLASFGNRGLVPLTLIISIHSLILLSLATVVVEVGRGHGGEFLATLEATARSIVTNPVIAAIIVGLVWHVLSLPIPSALGRFLDFLGAAATPAALFSLGATIAGFRIAGDLRESLLVVAVKLAAQPVLVWIFATRIFHLTPLDTEVTIVAAALPTGANAFILAQRYEIYVARAASSVLISTALSVLSLGALLAGLGPAH